MKRRLFIGFAATSLLGYAKPSHAVAVICANCADLVTQLWQQAKQAEQYVLELQSRATQLQQYANQVQNTIALPQAVWANVTGDIYAVRSLANAASILTGNSGSILTRLQGASGYASQAAYLPQNIGSQFTMWQQTIGNASNSLGRTLGLQQGQEQNTAALQAAIQAQSQSAAGQMQVLQASVEMAGVTNYNLQQVHTALVAVASEQAARDDIAAERQAIADAYTTQFLAQPPAPLTGYPSYR